MDRIKFDPYSAKFAVNPYPFFADLRENAPFYYNDGWGVTFVSRHEDVSKLLVDSRLGRSMDHVLSGAEIEERQSREVWYSLPNYRRYISQNLLETEGPDHIRLRRLLVKGFTRSQIDQQRGVIQARADDLLTQLQDRGDMDLLADFVAPLTVFVIASLLGLPEGDHHLLQPWSEAILRLYEKNVGAEELEAAELATTEFVDYLSRLLTQRRQAPGDDLISVLARVEEEGESLRNDELLSTCILLLNAGHESTVNAAGNGLLALFNHPEQLQLLREQPDLVESAVEEMLRFDPPLQYFHRYVLEDMEYAGQQFTKGETLGLLYGAANRDPAVFTQPDTFDINRPESKHLTFGKGRHFCLGAPLARLELDIVFSSLLSRFPGLTLGGEAPQYHPGLVFRGLKSLKLTW